MLLKRFLDFFFFFFFFLALGTLFCIYVLWRRGTRGSHVFGSDWAGGLVSDGNFSVSCIFQGKRGVPLTSHFSSLFFLLLFCHFPSACGASDYLWCISCPSPSQFPPDFKVCPLFKLYFLSYFLSF